MSRRPALTRERIVEAAAEVADGGGLTKVSMRNVGAALGVEAMSLYHHLAGKDELLDALADWIFTRIELPPPGGPWRRAMFERAESARRVFAEHPWALGLIESRPPGPALLRHHNSVLGCLRNGGFSVALAAHAFSVLDAYVYGFALTELNLPTGGDGGVGEFAEQVHRTLPAAEYPHLVEMMNEQVLGRDYAYANEFGYGLDLILDGLERELAGDR